MPVTRSQTRAKARRSERASPLSARPGAQTSTARNPRAKTGPIRGRSEENEVDPMNPLPCGSLPTVLGIDLGSSGIRMVLRYTVDGKWERMVMENDKARFRDDPRRDKGSFTSDCSELGKSAFVHTDVTPATGRSIKYHLYLLAEVSDKFLAQEFPWIAQEKKHLETIQDYKTFLERVLIELFTALAAVVERTCEARAKGLKIVRICLSAPSQFGHELSEIYENIVSKTFGLPVDEDDIVHCSEAQAMAHFLFDNHAEVEYETGVSCPDVGIFIDCGGHTASIAAYQIRYSESGEPTFIEIGSSCSTGGGTEDWLWGQISNRCEPIIMGQLNNFNVKLRQYGLAEMSQDELRCHWRTVRTEIMNKFFSEKKRAETDDDQFKAIRIPYLLPVGDTFENVSITQETIKECWENATNRIKQLLQNRLGELASTGSNIVTVVHGGTSRAPAMKTIISNICQHHGLPPPFFMETMAGLQRYDSITVANGAALLGCNSVTVEKALNRGAMFSVQVWQNYVTNPQRDSRAYRLVDMENKGPKKLIVPIETGDRAMILCDPMYQDAGKTSRKKWIDHANLYDFLDLSLLIPSTLLSAGHYHFEARLLGLGDEMKFSMKAERQPDGDGADGEREPEPTTINFPDLDLYWDRGQNCLLPGKPKMSLVEYLTTLGIQGLPRGDQEDAENAVATEVREEGRESTEAGGSQISSVFGPDSEQQNLSPRAPEQGAEPTVPSSSAGGSGWPRGILGSFRG